MPRNSIRVEGSLSDAFFELNGNLPRSDVKKMRGIRLYFTLAKKISIKHTIVDFLCVLTI